MTPIGLGWTLYSEKSLGNIGYDQRDVCVGVIKKQIWPFAARQQQWYGPVLAHVQEALK